MNSNSKNNQNESHRPEQQSTSDRLFSAVGHFGVYYAVADIAGTLGNHLDTSGTSDITFESLAITCFIGASIGAAVTDRLSHRPK